jgi:hypothetical protein
MHNAPTTMTGLTYRLRLSSSGVNLEFVVDKVAVKFLFDISVPVIISSLLCFHVSPPWTCAINQTSCQDISGSSILTFDMPLD